MNDQTAAPSPPLTIADICQHTGARWGISVVESLGDSIWDVWGRDPEDKTHASALTDALINHTKSHDRANTAEAELARIKSSTYCAYCGFSVDMDADAALVSEHIATCPKHPIRAVEAQRDTYLHALQEIIRLARTPPPAVDIDAGPDVLALTLSDQLELVARVAEQAMPVGGA